jgi:hypothetical protein
VHLRVVGVRRPNALLDDDPQRSGHDPQTFVGIARRMMRRSDTGKFEGEFTEEMTSELFAAMGAST